MSKVTTPLNPANIKPNQEQYTTFYSAVKRCRLFQYDYRASNCDLFSCVDKTLEKCIERRDLWLKAWKLKRH